MPNPPSHPRRLIAAGLAILAASLATTGAALAQDIGAQPVVAASLRSIAPVIDFTVPGGSFALPDAEARALREAGVARTAVDHRFTPGGLTGAVGYLCGVNSFAPGANEHGGPASAYGRSTTFLGAQISLPFR